MKIRVLFVSRERIRLPLAGAQARKWKAIASVVEPRVLAAAPETSPARDERFRLATPVRPRAFDGALFYASLPVRVARELRRFRPEVVIVQGVHEAAAVLIARRVVQSRAKVVLDVQGDWHEATRLYGSPFRRLLNPFNDALPPLVVPRVDAVKTVSTQTTGLVRALGVEPVAVFPAYVDAEAFVARPPAPFPPTPRAVFVGVLERYKAVDTLLTAWRRVARRVPDAVLHVVGDGTLREDVRALAQELPAQVEWSPRLDAEAVARAMDGSWLVCLPSRSEGLPRVALEAECRGRPVVGGNRAGIPDVVIDGVSGLLVDPDDAAALADALTRILSSRAEAERLGASARQNGEAWVVSSAEYGSRIEQLVGGVLEG